jgi:hypothetical protein
MTDGHPIALHCALSSLNKLHPYAHSPRSCHHAHQEVGDRTNVFGVQNRITESTSQSAILVIDIVLYKAP